MKFTWKWPFVSRKKYDCHVESLRIVCRDYRERVAGLENKLSDEQTVSATFMDRLHQTQGRLFWTQNQLLEMEKSVQFGD